MKWVKNLLHYAADGILFLSRWFEESLGILGNNFSTAVSVVKRPSGFFIDQRLSGIYCSEKLMLSSVT